jgi:hypothetical protein
MIRFGWKGLLAAAAMCGACGRGGDARNSQVSQTPSVPPAPSPPAPSDTPAPGDTTTPGDTNGTGGGTTPAAQLVGELRLLGVDQLAFTSARVKVSSVEASANGTALETSGLVDDIDLGVPTQAWLLGTFTVPTSADAVEVKIVFEDAGAFDAGTAHGTIDSACTVIVATLPVKLLALRGHAVVQLDVSRSLVRVKDDAAMLVPQFELAF